MGESSKVVDFQGIQWTVADCYSKLYAAALARDHAANLADREEDHSLQTTLAKKLAIDASEHAVNESFALIGAHGLYEETPFRQILCDMKVFRVGRPLFGHAVRIETGCFEISEVFLEVVLKTRVHKDPGIAAADQVDGFNALGAVDTGQWIPDPAAHPKPVSQVRSNGFGIAHIGRRGPRKPSAGPRLPTRR